VTSLSGLAPAWTEVSSFSNSWVNYGSGLLNAAYCKNAFGFVRLRGWIKSGTIGLSAFSLPTGYRPSGQENFAVASNSAYGEIKIEADGDVIPNIGNNTWFSLAGISFYTG
jgi:hypothetical protein